MSAPDWKRIAIVLLVGIAGRALIRRAWKRKVEPTLVVHHLRREDPRAAILDAALGAFRANFEREADLGAQLTVTLDGNLALEVCGGATPSDLMKRDELSMLFSSSKVIESLCVAKLVEMGKLRYEDTLVSILGPKFEHLLNLTVADLMRYRAGAAVIESPLTLSQVRERLASREGTETFVLECLGRDFSPANPRETAYHAYARGFFVALLMWSVDGRSIAEFVEQEVVAKVREPRQARGEGLVEFTFGCPKDRQDRVTVTSPAKHILEVAGELLLHWTGFVGRFLHPGKTSSRDELESHYQEWLTPEEATSTIGMITSTKDPMRKSLILVTDVGLGAHFMANSPEFRAIPMASVTGISNARSMALIMAELTMGGGRILSPEGLRKALQHDSEPAPYDRFMGAHITYSYCGWGLDRFGPGWIGWGGAGGSVCVFNPKLRLSLSYIPNRLEGRTHKPNGVAILRAIEQAAARIAP